jgi:hypothetical protein
MPDPAKSVGDIDDVLSSIRRLVAEQPSANRVGAHRGDAGSPQPDDNGRLVLTPALRVTDPDAVAEAPAVAEIEADAAADTPAGDSVAEEPAGLAHVEPEARDMTPEQDDDAGDGPMAADQTARDPEGGEMPVAHEPAASDEAAPGAEAAIPADPAMSDPAMAPTAESDMPEEVEIPVPEASADRAPDAAPDDAPGGDISDAIAPMQSDATAEELGDDVGDMSDHEAAQADAFAEEAEAENDIPDTDAAARVVGDAGWRPEMRLFDWDASAEAGDASAIERMDATAEFESDTGDADWPGEGADRAVLDLAAVREIDADTVDAGRAEAPPLYGAGVGFTPIFSRRATAKAGEATLDAGAPPTGEVSTDPDEPAEAAPQGGLAAPLTDDLDPAPDTQDDSGEAAGAEADAVTFSSVRDHEPGPQDDAIAPASSMTDHDPVPLPDETVVALNGQAAIGAEPDAGELDVGQPEAPRSRLTVLVGKGEDAAADAQTAVEEPEAAELPGEHAFDAGLLDEETLRRIVAEAVREELQGVLGERITRNVRKLVRREIRLVLAADELD